MRRLDYGRNAKISEEQVSKRPVFDDGRTVTENLYYILYEKWPVFDCPKCMVELLSDCIEHVCGGNEICVFLGLDDYKRVEPADDDEDIWLKIISEIDCLRDDCVFGCVIDALYANQTYKSYWKDIVDMVCDKFSDRIDETLAYILAEKVSAISKELVVVTSERDGLRKILDERARMDAAASEHA